MNSSLHILFKTKIAELLLQQFFFCRLIINGVVFNIVARNCILYTHCLILSVSIQFLQSFYTPAFYTFYSFLSIGD